MIKNLFLSFSLPLYKSLRVLWLFILFLTFSNKVSSQSFDWFKINPNLKVTAINPNHLPIGITIQMIDKLLASEYITSDFPITIYPFNDTYIALFSCRLEVLHWSGEQWINLYKGRSSGFNCKAHFFIKNGIIYSHGRYGFWNGHSETMVFDRDEGSWEIESVKNMPLLFTGSRIHIHGDLLYAINGRYIQQSHGKNQFEPNGFYFDFNSKEWHPLSVKMLDPQYDFEWTDYSYDLEDFGISDFNYKSYFGWLIFNKKDLSINFLKTNRKLLEDFHFAYGYKNQFNIVDRKGELVQLDFEGATLDKIQNIGNLEIVSAEQSIYSSTQIFIYAFLAFLIITNIFWLLKRRKINRLRSGRTSDVNGSEGKEQEDSLIEINLAIKHLLPYQGELLEVHKLDEVLKLDTIKNMDYRRVKRSRLVRTVNDHYFSINGTHFIERIKSEQDRRIIYFKILG